MMIVFGIMAVATVVTIGGFVWIVGTIWREYVRSATRR